VPPSTKEKCDAGCLLVYCSTQCKALCVGTAKGRAEHALLCEPVIKIEALLARQRRCGNEKEKHATSMAINYYRSTLKRLVMPRDTTTLESLQLVAFANLYGPDTLGFDSLDLAYIMMTFYCSNDEFELGMSIMTLCIKTRALALTWPAWYQHFVEQLQHLDTTLATSSYIDWLTASFYSVMHFFLAHFTASYIGAEVAQKWFDAALAIECQVLFRQPVDQRQCWRLTAYYRDAKQNKLKWFCD